MVEESRSLEPPMPKIQRYESKSPPPRMSSREPAMLFTFAPAMLIVFCATPPPVMSVPVGSIQVTPLMFRPNGTTRS